MSELIEVVDGEESDLVLHTKLCSLRYQQLINKFDEVDLRLDQLTRLVSEVKESVNAITTSALHTYLRWAGFIIVTLLGIVIHYAIK